MAAPVDDPATAAARHLDWTSLLDALDRTAKAILVALLEGRELTLLVKRLKRSRSALQSDKVRLGRLIREYLGNDILSRCSRSQPGPAPLPLSASDSPAGRSGGRNSNAWKGTWSPFP